MALCLSTPPRAQAAVITGGADGKVAVWLRRSRECLLQFTEHLKPVVAVIPDLVAPNLIHSAGKDRCVFSYDLKEERRTVGHQMSKVGVGAFTSLSQRKDSEQELVTGGTDGKLLFWDCDIIETPVLVSGLLLLLRAACLGTERAPAPRSAPASRPDGWVLCCAVCAHKRSLAQQL